MAFMSDVEELKRGLVLFRRTDVKHNRWYCRIKIPGKDRYKVLSLGTSDIHEAKDKAFDRDADLRFRIKHDVPVFNRSFRQVAQEFSAFQKDRADIGQITLHRWRVMASHISSQLDPYIGSVQISLIGEDRWTGYPIWRKKTGQSRMKDEDGNPLPISDGTIRDEMSTFRAIMRFAAEKKYIPESHIFKSRLPITKNRRDEFTPEEYRKLHSYARKWIKEADRDLNIWYRTMAYNFVLIMTNTGMRPSEARNLKWRDITERKDKQERKFVSLAVSGKGMSRELVAASNVSDYLKRIQKISNAVKSDDYVFSTITGDIAKTLYHSLIQNLLKESGLEKGPSGKIRSTYCFRHTYATFRLTEGTDVYFLAKQMGTSVKMIEDHYGHITPVKNAERILQGIPGWEPVGETPPS